MSHQAVSWALDIPKLRGPVKLVLVALADRADAGGGSCHPGITELARRASTSRRRVIEAIRLLEEVGAIVVQRTVTKEGKRRNVNRYQLAVGKEIKMPADETKAASKKGTRVVPLGNQGGSPGCTVTTTESPLNSHSDSYESARLPRKASGAEGGRLSNEVTAKFPDRTMVTAAQSYGIDPEHLSDLIAEYQDVLSEEALAGSTKARKQYRTLWFAALAGKALDHGL